MLHFAQASFKRMSRCGLLLRGGRFNGEAINRATSGCLRPRRRLEAGSLEKLNYAASAA
jgi:hypothetical protein